MTCFKLVFLIFIALQGAAQARAVDVDRMQTVLENFKLIVTGDSCKDCTQIIELLIDLISDTKVQDKIKEALDHLCDMLPGLSPSICKQQVEKNLPLVIVFLTSFVKPGETCTALGLCSGGLDGQDQQMLTNQLYELLQSPFPETQVEVRPKCTFCLYLIKAVEALLPMEKTEAAIVEVLEEVCGVLPSPWQHECEELIDTYMTKLLDLLLSSTSPQTICVLLHLCKDQDLPVRVTVLSPALTLSDCDLCLTLAVLTRMRLGSNATELQTASFLDSVCLLHPTALPKCESFTQRHGRQLLRVLGKQEAALDMCERVDLCVVGRVRESPALGGDLCTLGSSYRCRDLQTALKCGVVAFCQKHVWN